MTTTNPGFVTIHDDGKGIANPQDVMCLGQSNWDPDTMKAEDPAGMGIFSLANCGATIESNGWSIKVGPEHFSGKVAIEVKASDVTKGTRITFATKEIQSHLKWEIADASRYLPVAVHLDDDSDNLAQKDFLGKAIFTREWRGLRLGVVEGGYEYNTSSFVNFHGLIVKHLRPNLDTGEGKQSVITDVVNCPELQLILPSRKELVVNDFLKELMVECERILFESVRYGHCMSYKNYLRGKAFFPDMTEAKAILVPWYPTGPDTNRNENRQYEQNMTPEHVEPSAFIIDEDDYGLAFTMAHALEDAGLSIYSKDHQMKGYSWYDALRVLTVDHVTIDGVITKTDELTRDLHRSNNMSITLSGIDYPTKIVMTNPYGYEEITAYISDDCDDPKDLITDAFFCYDDSEDDGYEYQSDEFEAELELDFIRLFKGKDEALISQLRRAVANVAYMTVGRTATITLNGGNVDVTLTTL